jgi:hypothetical protein
MRNRLRSPVVDWYGRRRLGSTRTTVGPKHVSEHWPDLCSGKGEYVPPEPPICLNRMLKPIDQAIPRPRHDAERVRFDRILAIMDRAMFSTNANIMKLVKEKEGTIKTVVYPDLAKFMATYQDLFVILGVWQKEPNPVASASSSESARGSRRSLELPSGGPESKRLKASASIQTPVRIATPLSSTQSVPAKHRLPSDSESSSITTERVSSTTLKSTTPVLAALPSAAGKKTTSNPPSVSGKDRLLGDSTSSQTPTKRIGISMSELATLVLAARPPTRGQCRYQQQSTRLGRRPSSWRIGIRPDSCQASCEDNADSSQAGACGSSLRGGEGGQQQPTWLTHHPVPPGPAEYTHARAVAGPST